MKAYRRNVVLLWLAVFGLALLSTVLTLPDFGSERDGLTGGFVASSEEIWDSPNVVNAIVWGFRGYDTMGEELVLFSAALGVFLVSIREGEPLEIERD